MRNLEMRNAKFEEMVDLGSRLKSLELQVGLFSEVVGIEMRTLQGGNWRYL